MFRGTVSSNRDDAFAGPTISSEAVPEELVVVSGGPGSGLGKDSRYDHAMATERPMHPTMKTDRQNAYELLGLCDVDVCDVGNSGSVSLELLILLFTPTPTLLMFLVHF